MPKRSIAVLSFLIATTAGTFAAELAATSPVRNAGENTSPWKIGDSYTYRITDLFTKAITEEYTETITAVTDTQVVFDNGKHITDLYGREIRSRLGGQIERPSAPPRQYSVGQSWSEKYLVRTQNGNVFQNSIDISVVAHEEITAPAGTFAAFKLEGKGTRSLYKGNAMEQAPAMTDFVRWVVPELGNRRIREEQRQWHAGAFRSFELANRADLIAVKPANQDAPVRQ
ncbi:MAG: hypothetical protein K8S22_18795 [Betaproteobacteria bacterium]|nr:hypothetical protein [Betaproteobacteria bacterium]